MIDVKDIKCSIDRVEEFTFKGFKVVRQAPTYYLFTVVPENDGSELPKPLEGRFTTPDAAIKAIEAVVERSKK